MDQQRPLDEIPISPVKEDKDRQDGEETNESAAVAENQDTATAEQITVFHSAENFTVKHPLMNKWTLWFTKPPSGKGDNNWQNLLKEVVTFDSVEEFWGIYNNITKTSDLAIKSDYHLFKAGVRPEWEDPQNKYGGKWAHSFKRGAPIDELWLHVMLAAIGETLEKEGYSEVMGVVVNVRPKFYRIGVWTKNVDTVVRSGPNPRNVEEGRETLLEIGRRFKEVLRLPEDEKVEFSGHTESALSGSSRARAKFIV